MKIFKNKSVIRLYAFVTACLIILTLLLCGLNVCAESNDVDLGEYYDIPSGIYPDDNSGFPWLPLDYDGYWSGTHHDYAYQSSQYNGTTAFTVPQSDFVDNSIYPHYVMANNQGYLKFICLPEDSFIVGNNNNNSVSSGNICLYCNVNDLDSTTLRGYMFDFSSSNPHFYYYDDLNISYQNTQVVDGETYYKLYFNNSFNADFVYNTDVPCYYSSSLTISSTDDLENVNNNYSGVQDGETSVNNMYFKDFNISYSVSGLYSGNVVCYGTLNDYQKEHLDEFALTYTFNFDYSFYVPSVGGWTETFTKNYSYQQTLSDFYNNSSSKTFILKDIMQNVNTQDISPEYGNLYQLINHYANQGTGLDSVEVNWTKAKMKTTVFIVSANDSPSDILNSSDLHSNSFSKAYNFLDGKSSTYSDGITSNNNPYQTSESGSIENENQLNNMPNGVSSSNIPSSQGDNGGSGTSVVTGDNNIVINNNPTFNNDGSVSGSGGGSSDGGVASTFYNTFNPFKTLFSSLNGDNSVISDETADSIGANRFISVMSSTFSFIPEGMWTALTTFFIASLSILVVAVVIRVLLDLL